MSEQVAYVETALNWRRQIEERGYCCYVGILLQQTRMKSTRSCLIFNVLAMTIRQRSPQTTCATAL